MTGWSRPTCNPSPMTATKADLVTAADVFMYVGALEGIVATVAGMLAPDGLFAFSVEKLAGEGDFALQPSRRYAHSEAYVRRACLRRTGLSLAVARDARIIRQDRGEPVEGLIVVARCATLARQGAALDLIPFCSRIRLAFDRASRYVFARDAPARASTSALPPPFCPTRS